MPRFISVIYVKVRSIGKYQTKAPVGYLNVNKDIIIDEERAP